jgi:hypothetical protein
MDSNEESGTYQGRHRKEETVETEVHRTGVGYSSNSCSMMIHQNCSDRRCTCWCHS